MHTLINEYLAHIRAGGYSEDTIEDRRKLLIRLDRQLPYGIEKVATVDLERWLGAVRARPPSWTLCTYHAGIRAFYRWAASAACAEPLDFDPAADLSRPRQPEPEPHPATMDQLRLAVTLPRPWRTAVILAAFAGLRCGEIARLDREHIRDGWIYVLGKGGRRRLVPDEHPDIQAELADRPAGPILVNRRGGRYDPDYLSDRVSRRLTALGMPELTLHWFRAYYATTLLNNGVDIRTVQELLGHKQVTTTQIYTQVTDRQRRNAVATLPVLSSPQQEAA